MSYGKKALQQYQTVDLNTAVNNASPHKLVSMLFDGALTAIARAKGMMERQDVEGRTQQLNKATDIIVGLKSSLDLEQGEEVAANLDALYDYMLRQLMRANRENSIALLEEVLTLLNEVKSGWNEMPDESKKP